MLESLTALFKESTKLASQIESICLVSAAVLFCRPGRVTESAKVIDEVE